MKQSLLKKNYLTWALFNNPLSLLNDMLIFLLIFSFFNDNFSVEHLGENILKILFLLFVIFNAHAVLKNIKKMNLLHDKLFFVFFILFLIVSLIQYIMSLPTDLIKPVYILLNMIIIIPFFSYYPLKKTLYFIWVSMMISVIICFFNDPLSPWTFRTTGGTGDPNEFSAQLLAFMFISIYLFKINKSKVFMIITMIFFIYGFFMAGSMSAFLMLGVLSAAFIFKFLFYNFQHLFNYKLLLVFLFVIVGAIQVDFTKLEPVANMLDRTKDANTARYRMDSWVAGQHMIENHPFIGVGIDEFAHNTRKYAEVYIIHSPAPHNIYILIFAETGIIVFMSFLIFIATLLIQNCTIIINRNEIWILFAFLSLLLMGMTLGFFYDKYFVLSIAIMMNVHNIISIEVNKYIKGEIV